MADRLRSSLLLLALALPARAGIPSGAEPPAPMIARVEPSSGGAEGGTRVAVIGFNLSPDAMVSFGGVPATDVVYVRPGRIEVTTGPGRPGRVSVSVWNPDGRHASRGWAYRYVKTAPPVPAPP